MSAETLDVTSMLPNNFEPKRQNRWVLMIEGIDAFILKKAARPSISQESIDMPFINSRRYIAGRSEFADMQIELHDPIAPSGSQQVMEWFRTCYESVSGRAGYADFYKRDIQLKMLDPVGTVIEYWDIKGAFPTSVDFGAVDYENNGDPSGITVTLRYDNAVLQF